LKIPDKVLIGSVAPTTRLHDSPVSVNTTVAVVRVTGAWKLATPFASVDSPVRASSSVTVYALDA
jgi:hypothetical protein